jgi:hypothetical protein
MDAASVWDIKDGSHEVNTQKKGNGKWKTKKY